MTEALLFLILGTLLDLQADNHLDRGRTAIAGAERLAGIACTFAALIATFVWALS